MSPLEPFAAEHVEDLFRDEPVTASNNGQVRGEPRLPLEFVSVSDLAREVDAEPPIGWLCRSVWPADAYGIVAAEHKAGKTWAALDMVVAVAAGTAWLGVYPVERSGPVVAFLGEGGRRKTLRRLRAVAELHGVHVEDLPIELCFRAPHLANEAHLAIVAEKVDTYRPVAVVLDPLYLAARGAKSASLFDMGAHLERLQTIVQSTDAALVVIHHWNQTGTGRGAERMSGAGSAEWGRVLASAHVEHRSTDPTTHATSVTLGWEFVGDEIPDTKLRLRRRVWADDADDLSSPLHYEVQQLEAQATARGEGDGLTPAQRRVRVVLDASEVPLDVRGIGDAVAKDATGYPLKQRTIQDALKVLDERGFATAAKVPATNRYEWSAQPTTLEDESAV